MTSTINTFDRLSATSVRNLRTYVQLEEGDRDIFSSTTHHFIESIGSAEGTLFLLDEGERALKVFTADKEKHFSKITYKVSDILSIKEIHEECGLLKKSTPNKIILQMSNNDEVIIDPAITKNYEDVYYDFEYDDSLQADFQKFINEVVRHYLSN
ncbi:hypothetical protein [Thalassobacillus hwangdonensis]|uniref:DUF4375 domain-containing protein n=1 Tax=Thalassobacillus hwangdonensis TaxID=546108 RepID=A0ABW3L217_9BACI